MRNDNSKLPRDKREGTEPKDINDPSVQNKKPNENLQQDDDDESTPGEDIIDDTNAG
ncbi:MAG: hypothetical protein KA149_07200 [Chitinophagales bacterium]|nr:hypothetical protein [Chitinophagales bacterium]